MFKSLSNIQSQGNEEDDEIITYPSYKPKVMKSMLSEKFNKETVQLLTDEITLSAKHNEKL